MMCRIRSGWFHHSEKEMPPPTLDALPGEVSRDDASHQDGVSHFDHREDSLRFDALPKLRAIVVWDPAIPPAEVDAADKAADERVKIVHWSGLAALAADAGDASGDAALDVRAKAQAPGSVRTIANATVFSFLARFGGGRSRRRPRLRLTFLLLGGGVVSVGFFWFGLVWFGLEVCCYIYTSGTTGDPKAVMITHDNIIYESSVVVDVIGCVGNLPEEERIISYLPLSHVAGMMVDIVCPIVFAALKPGWCCVFFARAYDLKVGPGVYVCVVCVVAWQPFSF